MSNPYELFKTSESLEVEKGVPLDYGDFGYRIARAGGGNKRYNKMLEQKMKPFRRQIQNDSMDEEVATKLMVDVYVETIILEPVVKGDDGKLSKRGLFGPNGEILEGTKEQLTKQLLDLPDLFRDIQSQAGSLAIFRTESLQEDIKN